MSGQLHAPAALPPRKELLLPTRYEVRFYFRNYWPRSVSNPKSVVHWNLMLTFYIFNGFMLRSIYLREMKSFHRYKWRNEWTFVKKQYRNTITSFNEFFPIPEVIEQQGRWKHEWWMVNCEWWTCRSSLYPENREIRLTATKTCQRFAYIQFVLIVFSSKQTD
jgi:hypothetical protein